MKGEMRLRWAWVFVRLASWLVAWVGYENYEEMRMSGDPTGSCGWRDCNIALRFALHELDKAGFPEVRNRG